MKERSYVAIDLKSFYASAECRARGLDPLDTNLVVADEGRTDKTICLAVTPSLKSYGISGRARLWEVKQRVEEINAGRLKNAPQQQFSGKSVSASVLKENPALELGFIVAKPRMHLYMNISEDIFKIYLKYVSENDIISYSIDEVFMDVTDYLDKYKLTPRELTMKIVQDVLDETGITATAGIGTNLYLCKIAMDIVAKRMPADKNGVRIAELDESSYREQLWTHRPLTDFWRVGKGYAKKLEAHGMYTMGDIARRSVVYEDELYKLFGKNAELLIDHAWGWEPCTMEAIKAYRPNTNSLNSGQVLHTPYESDKAKLVLLEMTDMLALDLLDKGLVTNQIDVTIGYDIENLADPERSKEYQGEIVEDFYGRLTPKHAHGTANLSGYTSSAMEMMNAVSELYDRIVEKALLVRRLNVCANSLKTVDDADKNAEEHGTQLDLFTDYEQVEKEQAKLEREKKQQQVMLEIKRKFGKNSILKGMNYEEGATARMRNEQVGGHKA